MTGCCPHISSLKCRGSGLSVSRAKAAVKALSASWVKHHPESCREVQGKRRDSSPFWWGKVVAVDYLVQHWPPDQKVPSWNLITATVSRLNSKLCTVIWRPSVQGLTESPVIRDASYYRSPKSYLNRSLMWLWFPRTICCYCSSALLWVRNKPKLLSDHMKGRDTEAVELESHSSCQQM